MRISLAALAVLLAGSAVAQPSADEAVERGIQRLSTVLSVHRRLPASPRAVELGRRLFFEPALSIGGDTSCASCHIPSKHYTDGRPRAVGRKGAALPRNTPSILTAGTYSELYWDGRAKTIEETVLTAIQDPGEMAQPLPALMTKLKGMPAYAAAFAEAYPEAGISSGTLSSALTAFVLSVAPPEDSPFDHFLKDRSGLSPAARRGFVIFASPRGGCIDCHSSSHLNYNFRFHNIGLKPADPEDPGRYRVEPLPEMWGAFRVPSLRNVSLTAPYMHDGRLPTLEAVIDYYDRGGDKTRYQDSQVRPLHLTKQEKADLLAFLRSLDSSR